MNLRTIIVICVFYGLFILLETVEAIASKFTRKLVTLIYIWGFLVSLVLFIIRCIEFPFLDNNPIMGMAYLIVSDSIMMFLLLIYFGLRGLLLYEKYYGKYIRKDPNYLDIADSFGKTLSRHPAKTILVALGLTVIWSLPKIIAFIHMITYSHRY